MHKLTRTLAAAAFSFLAFPSVALAQQYELSSKAYTMKWLQGGWHGKHTFPGVYCVKFPNPEVAVDLAYALYNRGAIYLASVVYPENISASIVVSTIPPGRTPEFEMSRLANGERQAESAYGVSYNITEFNTAFGPTIGLRINNVADRSPNKEPFPLVRPIFSAPKQPILSMSVHRIFVRGLDRFEIAVLQLAKQPINEGTESEMTTRLTALADELVSSLQSCTAALPPRSAK